MFMFSGFGGRHFVQLVLAGAFTCLTAVPFAAAQEVITDEMVANADLSKGKRVFLRCRSCHNVAEGEPHKQGPNLHGLFGRKVGSVDDFTMYSDALKTADFVWTPDKLDAWLQSPREFLPGNRMSFVGLPKADDRINLIGYLVSEAGGAPDAAPASEPEAEPQDQSGEDAPAAADDASSAGEPEAVSEEAPAQ